MILAILFLLLFNGFYLNAQTDIAPEPPDGYWNNTFLKIAYVSGLLKLVDKEPDIPDEIHKYTDIVYKTVGERQLKLDLFQPDNLNQAAPVLVFIHGGGWKKGDKDDYRLYLVDFAMRGYITVTLSYRFSQEAVFPAALNDVKCAIRWIKTNAKKYNINPDKIAVIGGSAGGHLAMMIGYSSDVAEFNEGCAADSIRSSVQVVVNLYGPSDLTTDEAVARPSVKNFIGESYVKSMQKYTNASPINHITPDDPPTLIFHGTLDELVPVEQSDILNKKLTDIGVPVEYHRLKGWPHTMDMGAKINEYCQYYMNAFFEKYLVNNAN